MQDRCLGFIDCECKTGILDFEDSECKTRIYTVKDRERMCGMGAMKILVTLALGIALLGSCGRVQDGQASPSPGASPATSASSADSDSSVVAASDTATPVPSETPAPSGTPDPSDIPEPSPTASSDGTGEAPAESPNASPNVFPDAMAGIIGSNGWPVPMGAMTAQGLKYGFAGNSEGYVIQPIYQAVQPFTTWGLAVVTDSDGKCGVIDTTGRQVVPFKQASISLLGNGLILVYLSDGDGSFTDTEVMDSTGTLVFRQQGFLEPYAEGYAPSSLEGHRGYLDEKGNLSIPIEAEYLGDFIGGYAQVAVKYGEAKYYIGIDGKDATATVSSGISVFMDPETRHFGYKKADGSVLMPATFLDAEPFRDGTAIVQVNEDSSAYSGLYGLLGSNGKWRIKPESSGIRRLKNGLFAVGEMLKNASWMPYGYMEYVPLALYDADGHPLTIFVCTDIQDAGEGLAVLCDGKEIRFVDKTGQKADGMPTVAGTGILELGNGYLTGMIDGFDTVLNREGQVLAVLREVTDLGDGWLLTDELAVGNRFCHLLYPVLSGMRDGSVQDSINAVIKTAMGTAVVREPVVDVQTGVADIETLGGGWRAWRVGDLLCVEQDAYAYSLGAAHGMPMLQTIHIDLNTGKLRKLAELFKPDEVHAAMDIFSKLVTDKIVLEMDEVGYFVESVEVKPEQAFRLTTDGVTLYWPPYELASYAAGFREFTIPWAELAPVLDKAGSLWKTMKLP